MVGNLLTKGCRKMGHLTMYSKTKNYTSVRKPVLLNVWFSLYFGAFEIKLLFGPRALVGC